MSCSQWPDRPRHAGGSIPHYGLHCAHRKWVPLPLCSVCGVDFVTDPTSNDDFELLIDAHHIPDVDPGHECYPLPQNFSAGIAEGANATLQLVYIADFDDDGEEHGQNETFYACAGRVSSYH
jgi:hypothetical protein